MLVKPTGNLRLFKQLSLEAFPFSFFFLLLHKIKEEEKKWKQTRKPLHFSFLVSFPSQQTTRAQHWLESLIISEEKPTSWSILASPNLEEKSGNNPRALTITVFVSDNRKRKFSKRGQGASLRRDASLRGKIKREDSVDYRLNLNSSPTSHLSEGKKIANVTPIKTRSLPLPFHDS